MVRTGLVAGAEVSVAVRFAPGYLSGLLLLARDVNYGGDFGRQRGAALRGEVADKAAAGVARPARADVSSHGLARFSLIHGQGLSLASQGPAKQQTEQE